MPVPVREHSGQTVFFFDGFFVQLNGSGCFSEVATSLMRVFFQDGSSCYKTRISFYCKKQSCCKCCWEGQNFVSRAPVNRNVLNRPLKKKKHLGFLLFAIQSETLQFIPEVYLMWGLTKWSDLKWSHWCFKIDQPWTEVLQHVWRLMAFQWCVFIVVWRDPWMCFFLRNCLRWTQRIPRAAFWGDGCWLIVNKFTVYLGCDMRRIL